VILYADTSGLVKVVLSEADSLLMRSLVAQADETITVVIAYAELRAAIAAAVRDGRVPAERRDATMALATQLWDRLRRIALDWPLVLEAGDLAERHGLRGYDAVHLAALVRAGGPESIILACWDGDLRRAAASLGYTVLPP
jgi:hypothetical protein